MNERTCKNGHRSLRRAPPHHHKINVAVAEHTGGIKASLKGPAVELVFIIRPVPLTQSLQGAQHISNIISVGSVKRATRATRASRATRTEIA